LLANSRHKPYKPVIQDQLLVAERWHLGFSFSGNAQMRAKIARPAVSPLSTAYLRLSMRNRSKKAA